MQNKVAAIAGRQHGIVTAAQLAAAGFDRSAVARRVRSGTLHRLHRGVYAVGHTALGAEARWMAAVLAYRSAVLSHRSAAELWRLLPARAGQVHVTMPERGSRRRRRGIRLHRSRTLTADVVTHRQAIPCTTPIRTLADLPRWVPPSVLRQATRQAEVLGLDLGEVRSAAGTRSELEHRFLRLCHRHRLPPPLVNARAGGLTVDFLWPDRALIVETDGYRFHRGRGAFEEDRARDLRLRLQGFQVLRFSYRQVTEQPRQVIAALRPLLG